MCYNPDEPFLHNEETSATDAELVARSLDGDDDALVEVLTKYEALVREVIRKEIHEAPDPVDLGDDLYQDTVAKVIEHVRSGKSIAYPKAWMAQIARNLCVDYWRRQRRQRDFEVFAAWLGHGGRATVDDLQLQEVLKKEILEFLATQPEIYRAVMELRIAGHTAPQIAEQLELAVGTVKSRLNTFRRRLEEYYLSDELSDG